MGERSRLPLAWRTSNGHSGPTGRRRGAADGRIGGEMSALVVIVCDKCGDTGTVGHTPHEARAGLSAWARRGGLDLCPLCRLLAEAHDRLEATAR
jgi:hypothetical protein